MAWVTAFIVLIERRLRQPLALLLLAAGLLAAAPLAQAGAGPMRKTARDLIEAVSAPVAPGHRWVRQVASDRRLVDAVLVSDAADKSMQDLRAHVERLGGTVKASFRSVQALSVVVPSQALAELDARDDVVAITPNRTTRHVASEMELTSGAASTAVRTATGLLGYAGLDGSGIGIAVLDSGVMASHRHLANAYGRSRVVRQVNMVGQGANLGWAAAQAPGSAARNAYEAQVNAAGAWTPDPWGHGTHVAAVAAGRGSYQTQLDTTGIAPGASVIDVRVLADDGTGNMADVIAGLDWVLYNARQYNIRVVNLSLSAGSTNSWVQDPLAMAARAVVASGIVVVTAAGNYGQAGGATTFGTIGSPAHDPSVITVGSKKLPFSPMG